MGSSLAVHDCSSLRFGAASACEFEEVNSVNVNGFFQWWVNIICADENVRCLPQEAIPFPGCFLH